jgi:hypothetical protein
MKSNKYKYKTWDFRCSESVPWHLLSYDTVQSSLQMETSESSATMVYYMWRYAVPWTNNEVVTLQQIIY